MSLKKDLIGSKFGRLTAIEYAGNSSWECLCDCGSVTVVKTSKLTSEHTKSCGCYRRELLLSKATTHGLGKPKEYSVWAGMIQRCTNENNTSYNKYGGRGIKIEDGWLSFEFFLHDMGKRPSDIHTIERRDVDGHYCKDNCYWTDDLALQAINQNLKSNNTSGKSGVYWRKDRNRWVAKIFFEGNHVMLGSFVSKEDAISCRKEAEMKYYGMEKPDGVG